MGRTQGGELAHQSGAGGGIYNMLSQGSPKASSGWVTPAPGHTIIPNTNISPNNQSTQPLGSESLPMMSSCTPVSWGAQSLGSSGDLHTSLGGFPAPTSKADYKLFAWLQPEPGAWQGGEGAPSSSAIIKSSPSAWAASPRLSFRLLETLPAGQPQVPAPIHHTPHWLEAPPECAE